jgi:hypothetical protein
MISGYTDIGTILISGHTGTISGSGVPNPDILTDVVPDIMTFPQPVLPLFPAAAAAAAAAYSVLRNPCY